MVSAARSSAASHIVNGVTTRTRVHLLSVSRMLVDMLNTGSNFWLPRILAIIDALHMIFTLLSVCPHSVGAAKTYTPLTVPTAQPSHHPGLSKLPHSVHRPVRIFSLCLASFEILTSCTAAN